VVNPPKQPFQNKTFELLNIKIETHNVGRCLWDNFLDQILGSFRKWTCIIELCPLPPGNLVKQLSHKQLPTLWVLTWMWVKRRKSTDAKSADSWFWHATQNKNLQMCGFDWWQKYFQQTNLVYAKAFQRTKIISAEIYSIKCFNERNYFSRDIFHNFEQTKIVF